MPITRSVSTSALATQGITNPVQFLGMEKSKLLMNSLTSVGQRQATFDGGNGGPLSSAPSTSSTTGVSPQSQPAPGIVRAGVLFSDTFRETALEALFKGNSPEMEKNCVAAKKLYGDSTNILAQQNISDFAKVYLSLLRAPARTPEQQKQTRETADLYIKAICKDGLGEKSAFSGMHNNKSSDFIKRQSIEKKLIAAGNLGDSSARAALGKPVESDAAIYISDNSLSLLGNTATVKADEIRGLMQVGAAMQLDRTLEQNEQTMVAGGATLRALALHLDLLALTTQLLENGEEQPATTGAAAAPATPPAASPAAATPDTIVPKPAVSGTAPAVAGVPASGGNHFGTINISNDHSTVTIDDHSSSHVDHYHQQARAGSRKSASFAAFVPVRPVPVEIGTQTDNVLQEDAIGDNHAAPPINWATYPGFNVSTGKSGTRNSAAKSVTPAPSEITNNAPKTSNATELPTDMLSRVIQKATTPLNPLTRISTRKFTLPSRPPENAPGQPAGKSSAMPAAPEFPAVAGSEGGPEEYADASVRKFRKLQNIYENFISDATKRKSTLDSKASRLIAGQWKDRPYSLVDLDAALADKAAKSGSTQGPVSHPSSIRVVELTVNRETEARTHTGGRV